MSEDPAADIQNTWVPGSTFKGITAAIGGDSGKLDPAANMGYVDLSTDLEATVVTVTEVRGAAADTEEAEEETVE